MEPEGGVGPPLPDYKAGARPLSDSGGDGAGSGIRTRDLMLTKHLLYQLSYPGHVIQDAA